MDTAGPTTGQRIAAETIGTFVLVFFGCGSVVYAGQVGAISTVTTIGLTFGIAVMVMVYAFGRVSGGHFNPAVTLGAVLGGRTTWRDVPVYLGSQLLGAVAGAAALWALMQGFPGFDATGNLGQNGFGDAGTGYAAWSAFLLEMLLTAVFVTVILAVTDSRNEHPAMAPLAIGLTLAAIHFVAIPATGTSVNPARSLGPALFAGTDAIMQLWLFILAPLFGAAVAGLAYPMLFGHGSDPVAGSGIPRRAPVAVPGHGAPDQLQQQWNRPQAGDQPQAEPAPIIQDGWQWDPVAHQWRPVEQPPAPRASGDDDGRTQIRP